MAKRTDPNERAGRVAACRHRLGFSILEILVVMVILSVAIVPMMRALAPSILASRVTEQTSLCANRAVFTLTRICALDYAELASHQGAAVSLAALLGNAFAPVQAEADLEALSVSGTRYSPTVSILPFVDPATSLTVTGALQIVVAVGPVKLTTLRTDY